MDGYVVRMKNGFVYGYSSNIYVFPDLKLGKENCSSQLQANAIPNQCTELIL